MIYGETGRYPLLIDSTIRSLRYWLKITNMPLNRFPRQAYIMLRNDVETTIQNNQSTGLHNWAKDIKECLEAYGFHDVWLNGRVADKSAFLFSFKNRMIGRFRGDWYSKISTSDRFSTYKVFKVTHQKDQYLDSLSVNSFVADSTDSFKRLEASVSFSLKIFELTASLNRSALSGSHLNTVRCSFLLVLHFVVQWSGLYEILRCTGIWLDSLLQPISRNRLAFDMKSSETSA